MGVGFSRVFFEVSFSGGLPVFESSCLKLARVLGCLGYLVQGLGFWGYGFWD